MLAWTKFSVGLCRFISFRLVYAVKGDTLCYICMFKVIISVVYWSVSVMEIDCSLTTIIQLPLNEGIVMWGFYVCEEKKRYSRAHCLQAQNVGCNTKRVSSPKDFFSTWFILPFFVGWHRVVVRNVSGSFSSMSAVLQSNHKVTKISDEHDWFVLLLLSCFWDGFWIRPAELSEQCL